MYSSPFSTLVFSVLPADRSKCTRPLSTLVFPCDASRSAVFADRIVSRPPRAADPRTATARPDLSLSAAAVRAALSLLYLSTLALSRQLETLHASLSLYARAFLPPRSAIYRPRLARAADPRVTITNRRTTRTVPVPVPVLRTSTHTGAHRLFSALFVPREAQYRPPRLVLGLTGGPPTSFGGGE